MAGVFGVSRSGYYAWGERGPSLHEQQDMEFLDLIREIFEAHYKRYGSPRIWEDLRQRYGRRVSRKRIERLMRENGLQARRKKKFIPTTDSSHTLGVAPNILNRDFTAAAGGRVRIFV
jgi:transposase InsO family protein